MQQTFSHKPNIMIFRRSWKIALHCWSPVGAVQENCRSLVRDLQALRRSQLGTRGALQGSASNFKPHAAVTNRSRKQPPQTAVTHMEGTSSGHKKRSQTAVFNSCLRQQSSTAATKGSHKQQFSTNRSHKKRLQTAVVNRSLQQQSQTKQSQTAVRQQQWHTAAANSNCKQQSQTAPVTTSTCHNQQSQTTIATK